MDAPDPIADAVTAVDARIAARLAELTALDPELAKLRAARDALAGLCGPPAATVPAPAPTPVAVPIPETPPGKPTPPVPVTGPGEGHLIAPTHHAAAQAFARRLEVARLIAREGPQRAATIQGRCDIPSGSFAALIGNCPWFEKADPLNRLSPWSLSPAGRSALAAAPGSSSAPG